MERTAAPSRLATFAYSIAALIDRELDGLDEKDGRMLLAAIAGYCEARWLAPLTAEDHASIARGLAELDRGEYYEADAVVAWLRGGPKPELQHR